MEKRENNLIENSKKKLTSKKCNMIIANNLNDDGAGFGVDTNKVTIITKDNIEEFETLSKKQVAVEILNKVLELYENGEK